MKTKTTLILLLILHLSFGVLAQDNKHVLFISSYNSRFPTYFQQINGIKSVLDSANVDMDLEFMDSKRFTDPETQDLFYKKLQHKLSQNIKYDAVLTADDAAFNFALKQEEELFKNIPIVFFGVNNIEKAVRQNTNPNVTGVVEAVSMKETLALMLQFFPETKSIYAIADGTTSGQSDLKGYRQMASQRPEIEFKEINLSQLSFAEYKAKLKAIPAKTPVLLLSAYQDKEQHVIDFNQTFDILKKNLHAPLFHLWEHGMGKGVLGGKLISHYEQGKMAASMVKNILSGQAVSSVKVVDLSPNIYKFDYNQLTKYKIALDKLPKGAIIVNRPLSFLQKNKRLIIIVLIVFYIMLVLIVVLLGNVLKRKIIEKQLKIQNAAILKLNGELVISKEIAEEGQQKFKQLFYEHSAIKLLTDAETGIIFDANPAATTYYGWSLDEITQMNISDINTLSFSEIKKEMENAKTKGRVHFEFKHRKTNGDVVDVEVFTSSIVISGKEYLYSIIHDVSEKKKQEHKIRLLSRSVVQSPVAVVITNRNGVIEYVNPAFTDMSGYSYDEAIGQNPRILKSGQTSDFDYNELWQTICSGKTWTSEIQNRNASGELYWVNIAISPIYCDNELTDFVAICEDITEKKKIIKDLVVAKEKAEESNKLKIEFLHNMSHEIRTPMNGIIGFSEMLNDEGLDKETRKEFTDIVIKSSYQLLNIIDDILEISRLETRQVSIQRETFSLNTLMKELYALFSPKAIGKGLTFLCKIILDDDASYITTDKAKLNRILINFIENALKFTSQGTIELGYYIKENELVLFVKDSGIGISDKNRTQIFERFVQEEKELSQKYGGIGLGLAISKENASLLGGTITVESEKNNGSTFYLHIPYDFSENLEIIALSEIPKIESEKQFTILVAEDEEINYLYIETLLKSGFNAKVNLIHTFNGQEAVEACIENPAIDLVLMDVKMPVLNGYEATVEIRKHYPNLPIIALTAYSTESDKELAYNSGCDAFVSKPIDRKALFDLLEKYLIKK